MYNVSVYIINKLLIIYFYDIISNELLNQLFFTKKTHLDNNWNTYAFYSILIIIERTTS